MNSPPKKLAFLLEGGGARSAWQVGVLRGLGRALPELVPRILVGVSAGGINASHLANFEGEYDDALEDLAQLWGRIDIGSVFRTHPTGLVTRLARVGLRLATGWSGPTEPILGMVDTCPLRKTLQEGLHAGTGPLEGVRRNVESGRLEALALLTTRYATGQTICFFQGGDVTGWERPNRRGIATQLHVDHVMASASLPLFFPPVQVGRDWYGDGGIRLVAPLAPAVHLGAERILALSTRYPRTTEEAEAGSRSAAPSPALIAGNLFNAIFLDSLDQDASNLERVNRLVEHVPEERRSELREIELTMLRPSRDLGLLAGRFEPELPWLFRKLLRNLGTGSEDSQDLLSTVLFEPGYVRLLIELGEEDGSREAERVAERLLG